MTSTPEQSATSPWEHVGPGTPGGRLLRSAWQPVSRSCDVVSGVPVRIEILAQHFTLYRGQSGRAALLADRCPHRATMLSVGMVDGDDLRCHHHGWRFAPSGTCVARPGDETGIHARCHARSYPVQEYLGLVFAWLGDGDAPPLPRHPEYELPGVLRVLPVDAWPCTFFQRLENSCDFWHLESAHALSGVGAIMRGELALTTVEHPDGMTVEATVGGRPLAPVRFSLPNLLEFQTPVSERVGWRNHLVWRVPIDDGRCASFVVTLVPADVPDAASYRLDAPIRMPFAPTETARLGEEVLAGRVTLGSLSSRSLTEVEDYVALVGQGSAGDRAHEALGRLDAPVVALRRRWRRAVAEAGLLP